MEPTLTKRRLFRMLGLLLLAVLLLIGLIILWLSLFFDANSVKPRLVAFAENQYSRKLEIGGDLSLSFFPGVAIVAKKLKLTEPDGITPFVSADRVRAGVALLPLLSDRLLLDGIEFDGVAANIERKPDGEWNFNNLIPRGPARFASIRVDRIALVNAKLRIAAGAGQPIVELTEANAQVAPVAAGVEARWSLDGNWRLAAKSLSGKLDGSGKLVLQAADDPLVLRDVRFKATLSLADARELRVAGGFAALSVAGERLIDLELNAEMHASEMRIFALRAKSAALPFDLARISVEADWEWPQADWTGNMVTALEKQTPSMWRLADMVLQARNARLAADIKLAGSAALDVTQRSLAMQDAELHANFSAGQRHTLNGKLALNADSLKGLRAAARFAGTLDQSRASTQLRFPQGGAGRIGFNGAIDFVDVKNWSSESGKPAPPLDAIDLAPLRALPLAGVLTIGTLQSGATVAKKVRIEVD